MIFSGGTRIKILEENTFFLGDSQKVIGFDHVRTEHCPFYFSLHHSLPPSGTATDIFFLTPVGDGIAEQGATWIHGIEGNPVYECIEDKNILSSCESSSYWRTERFYFYQDGETLPRDLVTTVGGLYTEAITQSSEFSLSEKEEAGFSKSVGEYLEKEFNQFAQE